MLKNIFVELIGTIRNWRRLPESFKNVKMDGASLGTS